MGLRGLPSVTMQFPFATGLNQKPDLRSRRQSLDICKDVQFDEAGGVQTRKPFESKGVLDTGGSTITNFRTCEQGIGDELLMFTKDKLYSRQELTSRWALRGEHLAVVVDETVLFATNADQQSCDRAELGGTVVYTWVELNPSVGITSAVYVAAVDVATGAVSCAPTAIGINGLRPRVVALNTVLLVVLATDTAGKDLAAVIIDPTNVASSILAAPTTISAAANYQNEYDIAPVPGTNQIVFVHNNVAITYRIGTALVTGTLGSFGLTVASTVKARTSASAPIAVAVTPNGTQAQVARVVGATIIGDLITVSTRADVFINQAIGSAGSSVLQMTAAYRTVQVSGNYRCVVFWSLLEGGTLTTESEVRENFVDNNNTLGGELVILAWCGIGSHAFDRDGRVFVWAEFNASGDTLGNLQGCYVLYRDDGYLTATSRVGNAYQPATIGHLPGVQRTANTDEYAFAGVYVRDVAQEAVVGFKARAPRDIVCTFDSNEARRVARFGESLYISGSPILQYDGVMLAECGWIVGPWHFSVTDNGAGGSLSAGTYAYKTTLRGMNARGEIDRSSSFAARSLTLAGSHKVISNGADQARAVWLTRRTRVTHEYWRTIVNPTDDSPFYLISSNDPAGVNPNAYVKNSSFFDGGSKTLASFQDNEADGTASGNEENPENGGVLENLPPPPARIVLSDPNRLFLAGVAGEPDIVWYSKFRQAARIASFNDVLTIEVPKIGGDITALAFLNEQLVVFREHAIYIFAGDGLDNVGNGSNYGPPHVVSVDLGAVSQEAVVTTDGGIIFKSSKGWYLLGRGLDVQNIGDKITSYDAEQVNAVHVMPAQHQLRIVTANRVIIFDTAVGQWGEWTISDGIHACVWNGVHVYMSSTGGVMQQRADFTGVTYGMELETAWIPINELQGRGIVRMVNLLGEYRSAHHMQVRVARNFESDGAGGWNYNYTKTWAVTPTVVGGPEQLRFAPSEKRMQAVKVRLKALAIDNVSAPSGEACKLTGLAFSIAVEEGLYQGLAASQKQ